MTQKIKTILQEVDLEEFTCCMIMIINMIIIKTILQGLEGFIWQRRHCKSLIGVWTRWVIAYKSKSQFDQIVPDQLKNHIIYYILAASVGEYGDTQERGGDGCQQVQEHAQQVSITIFRMTKETCL